MPPPFKIGCPCGFMAETPQAFIDHALMTGHVKLPTDADDGSLLEMVRMLGAVQQAAANEAAGLPLDLPDGAEITAVSREDVENDDDLSDEDKQEILRQLDAVEAQRSKKDMD